MKDASLFRVVKMKQAIIQDQWRHLQLTEPHWTSRLHLLRIKLSKGKDLLGGAAHVYTRSWCVRALCDREVYPDPSTINLLVTHRIFGSLGVFLMLEIDETKTS